MKDFYAEINRSLKSYEEGKPWHEHDIYWICDKIDWCNKWKKLPEEQVTELVDRVCKVMDDMTTRRGV